MQTKIAVLDCRYNYTTLQCGCMLCQIQLGGTQWAAVDNYASVCGDLDLWANDRKIYQPTYICDQNWGKFPSLLRPGRGADYCDLSVHLSVCLCVCLQAYLWKRFTDPHDTFCADPVAMARSSSGGTALRYVLPILWMMSRLVIVGRMS